MDILSRSFAEVSNFNTLPMGYFGVLMYKIISSEKNILRTSF